jgi:predicted enzyme related to lactoylglutathione lyase
MPAHHTINYIEMPARNIAGTRAFFEKAFGWAFVDYGPAYTSFSGQGTDGGFFQSDLVASTDTGSALVVIYSNALEATLAAVQAAGGEVLKPIFSFPGGRRFHFACPSGNEYAVWSE